MPFFPQSETLTRRSAVPLRAVSGWPVDGWPFRGNEALVEQQQAFQAEWQRWEAVPVAVLDLGERLVVLGTLRLAGKVSGVELERKVSQLVTMCGGLAARQQIFMAWGERVASGRARSRCLPVYVVGEADKAASSAR